MGFIFAFVICGVGVHLIGKESEKLNESTFMVGYVVKISTLVAVQNESDSLEKEKLVRSELCEALLVLRYKIENSNFNQEYFEVVANRTVSEYQSLLSEIESHHCEQTI